MSRGSLDQLDAMRYATVNWQKTREELLNRPMFCVQGIIDKLQPQISDMVEKNLRRQLLEGIAEVLCDGEYHVVRIKRQEEILPPLLPTTYLRSISDAKVTYRAEITEVQHRHHRKKDRAKARRLRAERKKLAERLKANE